MTGPERAPLLEVPLTAFRARTPIRTWSLIVSFLGDAVLPRGGVVQAGVITTFCGLAGLDAGPVRTALSRLVAGGIVSRSRDGRHSHYRLTEAERRAFADASALIYGHRLPLPTGEFEIISLASSSDRAERQSLLKEQRFVALAPTLFIRPAHAGDAALVLGSIMQAEMTRDAVSFASRTWPVDELASGYERFCRNFEGMARGQALPDEDAVLARVLLVHEFRRALLRDPFLPDQVLPQPWAGSAARALFAAAHAVLSPAAERWLDAQDVRP